MILTQTQAKAIYRAMCEMNDVNGRIHVHIEEKEIRENRDGTVEVLDWAARPSISEKYPNQTAFAHAYQLS